MLRELASSNLVISNALLKIPLDKELTTSCLVQICTKLAELNPAVMVKYHGLN